jgi:hypothetical protein
MTAKFTASQSKSQGGGSKLLSTATIRHGRKF